MQTFQVRHNLAGTGDREVPYNGGEFRFVRVVRGWFPGAVDRVALSADRRRPFTSNSNGTVSVIEFARLNEV
jgi:hypothetical protein